MISANDIVGAAAPAAGYQTGQVYVAPQTYAQQRPATGYEAAYQATHTAAATYTYPPRQAEAVATPIAATQTYDSYAYARTPTTTTWYDTTKTYYQAQAPQHAPAAQPTAAENWAAGHAAYAAAASKAVSYGTTYNTNTRQSAVKQVTPTYNYAATAAVTTNANVQVTATPSYSASYSTTAAAAAAPTYSASSYDAAVYSGASMYLQQQQQQAAQTGTAAAATARTQRWTGAGGAAGGFKKAGVGATTGTGGIRSTKPKLPPKPLQLHYCDVCKISCAGPQTFREHLEGQKHKKKEAASKSDAAAAAVAKPANSLRCELCDVTCTGADAYAAHIRGAKHQKVVKLHTRLGKAIPSTEPVVVSSSSGDGGNAEGRKDGDGDKSDLDEKISSDIQPVGQDYIEEIKNEEGKVISFQCKLCDCRFSDPNAKEMHMKGRRHRLQYKKKVNPDLYVDIKPSLRQRKLQEDKQRRMQMNEEYWRRRGEEMRLMEEEERIFWEERRRFEEEAEYFEWCRRFGRDPHAGPPMVRGGFGQPPMGVGGGPPMRRVTSPDDRHVNAKHGQIYPTNEELQAVQQIVSNTEKALKLVSDQFAGEMAIKVKKEPGTEPTPPAAPAPEPPVPVAASTPPAAVGTAPAVASGATPAAAAGNAAVAAPPKKDDQADIQRVLKGVMRVGVLAKGLLLTKNLHVQLVILCSEKPTLSLLTQIATNLPKHLAAVTEEKYECQMIADQAAITVHASTEPKVLVTITLTSPIMRDAPPEGSAQADVKDPPDVLDKQKCLEALAALRHAKWFQARVTGLQSCVMIIRILRDICLRIPTWAVLNSWAMELLAEKVISSAGQPLAPGDALRRVLEAIACGILLPGGPGLLDPCEKEAVDATAGMSVQEREDITASAQHALRLVSYRQIHKVLGMDALPSPPKQPWTRFNRKRRRDNSAGETNEEGDGKKDKKEDGEAKTDGMEVDAEAKS